MQRLFALAVVLACVGCSGSDPVCGTGTTNVNNQCVALNMIDDPLVGAWTPTDLTSCGVGCEFFSNHSYTHCCWTNGWPSQWDRLEENRYWFGLNNGSPCTARTTFAADNNSVIMEVDCYGFFGTGTYNYTRVPPP